MNKLNVGDYVRTRWGCIAKFEGIHEGFYEFDNIIMDESSAVREELFVDIVEKSSPNIIDLIEVGDYVNGYKVIDIVKGFKVIIDKLEVDTTTGLYHNIGITNIETVVAKEQFENISYKVGE